MATFERAKVKRILGRRKGLSKAVLELAGKETPAINYDDLTGEIKPGDEVIVNTTAVELSLGSGGFHIVHWNLTRDSLSIESPGHIMKLRYTPLQFNCLSVEEKASGFKEKLDGFSDLDGMPVIVGTLHSQLAPAAAVVKKLTGGKARVAYLMTDRAALALSLSDTVAELKKKKIVDATITIGQAFGGDYEAVNIYSGLAAAKAICQADVTIVTMGIGVVGTETYLGFSGIEQGEIVNAVHVLKGRPIAIPRISFEDPRPRHQVVSEQTLASLGLAPLVSCDVPVPQMDKDKLRRVLEKLSDAGITTRHRVKIVESDGTLEALEEFGLEPTTMGRSVAEEPEFFRAAGAAGYLAVQMLQNQWTMKS